MLQGTLWLPVRSLSLTQPSLSQTQYVPPSGVGGWGVLNSHSDHPVLNPAPGPKSPIVTVILFVSFLLLFPVGNFFPPPLHI